MIPTVRVVEAQLAVVADGVIGREHANGADETVEVVAEALGEHVFDFFLRNKRAEWENYRSHVTPFELKAYLSL